MAELSSRMVSSFSRSVSSGRVFARWEADNQTWDPLVESLNYVTTPGVIESAADVRGAGRKVLAFLKAQYPTRSGALGADRLMGSSRLSKLRYAAKPRRSLNLAAGWRVNFYSASTVNGKGAAGGSSLLGFYIDHRLQERARVRTIIASLESGSRGYRIYPVRARALLIPSRGGHAFSEHANIPSRRGFGFLRKTEEYADSLLAAHGSLLEQELARIIEKGHRMKLSTLSAASDNEPTEAISSALEALGEESAIRTLSRAKSPLKAIRTLKKKLISRKFPKSYR